MHRKDPNLKNLHGASNAAGPRRSGRLTCSTCGQPFHIDESTTPPFCSQRCQMVDLGRWLDEEISVPHEGGNSDVMGNRSDPFAENEDEDDLDDELRNG
ncbi:DNA gyrase inhibitor YacG [Rubripirellula tenax]|uniref:DNA gyrase inhibitor YacG n=1 Tax=Rubripirellula tenax TaxID=2528015 RepID=A0A5C6FLN5_9BACT|nr:DNA gyrase inhibitor YacG [Rubripirellula tenax]TWU60724.1 DNA gyrase inhibitor YacG [Rubripirellula tenax]